MMYFVFGGSASGKSEYAENLAVSCGKGGGLLYVATMRREGEEAAARIRKHREQRRGKGFRLYEAESLPALKDVPQVHTILFDCLSNFTANVMFSEENLRRFAESESLTESERNSFFETLRISLVEEIGAVVEELAEKCENLVIVSDFVFSDGVAYDPLTELYLRLLGDLWRRIALQAEEVTEIVFGLPMRWKP